MKATFYEYEISDDKSLLQIESIHAFLKNAYWSKGIPIEIVQQGIRNSICFGVYRKGLQVGFARVISDECTFAYLSDVYIDPQHRGQGLSKELMTFIMNYPRLQGLRRFCLMTYDAHSLYEKFGFRVSDMPQNFMEIKDNNIYLKSLQRPDEVGK